MDSQYLLLLITFFIALFVYLFTSFIYKYKLFHDHQDIEPYPILGHLPQFIKNRERFHDWMTELLTTTPTNTMIFHRPPICGIITADPAYIQHMLKTNFDNYTSQKNPTFTVRRGEPKPTVRNRARTRAVRGTNRHRSEIEVLSPQKINFLFVIATSGERKSDFGV